MTTKWGGKVDSTGGGGTYSFEGPFTSKGQECWGEEESGLGEKEKQL